MDVRQHLDDPSTAMAMETRKRQSQMWTAIPGIIQSFDLVKMTCEVQPAIQGTKADPKTGATSHHDMPLLVDCPVCFPSGGGAILTFPIAEGDECLVVFSSRCIDVWWQQGGVQPPMSQRMHSLSDGFAILGARSQAKAVAGISTTTTQLRSVDGTTCIELNTGAQSITLTAPGGINLIGPLNLGDEGGAKVARIGDSVSGGVITSGSDTVKAV